LLHPGDLRNTSLPSFKVRLPVNPWSRKAWEMKLEKRRKLFEVSHFVFTELVLNVHAALTTRKFSKDLLFSSFMDILS